MSSYARDAMVRIKYGKEFYKEALWIFVLFFLITAVMRFRYQLMLLASVFIVLGPVIIAERFVWPKKYQNYTAVLGVLSTFLGIYLLYYSFNLLL